MTRQPIEGEKRLPADEVELRGYVTHEYHLRMIRALIAERKEAERERDELRERAKKLLRLAEIRARSLNDYEAQIEQRWQPAEWKARHLKRDLERCQEALRELIEAVAANEAASKDAQTDPERWSDSHGAMWIAADEARSALTKGERS